MGFFFIIGFVLVILVEENDFSIIFMWYDKNGLYLWEGFIFLKWKGGGLEEEEDVGGRYERKWSLDIN